MPALLMSTSIASPSSLPANARTSSMLATSMRSTCTFECSSTMGASDSGMPSRRCVAMTFQPFAAYCLTNSSPKPEFAPVISTVSASAADGTTSVLPMSSAAPSASAERLSIAIPPRCGIALWYRVTDHCGAPGGQRAQPQTAQHRSGQRQCSREGEGDAERRRERAGRAGRGGEQLPRSRRCSPRARSRVLRRTSAGGTRFVAARRRLPVVTTPSCRAAHAGRTASSAARPMPR